MTIKVLDVFGFLSQHIKSLSLWTGEQSTKVSHSQYRKSQLEGKILTADYFVLLLKEKSWSLGCFWHIIFRTEAALCVLQELIC